MKKHMTLSSPVFTNTMHNNNSYCRINMQVISVRGSDFIKMLVDKNYMTKVPLKRYLPLKRYSKPLL